MYLLHFLLQIRHLPILELYKELLPALVQTKLGITVFVLVINNGIIIVTGRCSSGTAANFAISFTSTVVPACVNRNGENCLGCVASVSKTQITTSTGGHGGNHWNSTGTSVSYICVGF